MTRACHGLTLVEVLAATVLLALVAGTCASLVRDAAAALTPARAGGPAMSDLGLLADHWLDPADEQQGGSPVKRWLISDAQSLDMTWPDDPSGRAVHIRRLALGASAQATGWVEFESDGTTVWRWVDLARLREEAGW